MVYHAYELEKDREYQFQAGGSMSWFGLLY